MAEGESLVASTTAATGEPASSPQAGLGGASAPTPTLGDVTEPDVDHSPRSDERERSLAQDTTNAPGPGASPARTLSEQVPAPSREHASTTMTMLVSRILLKYIKIQRNGGIAPAWLLGETTTLQATLTARSRTPTGPGTSTR